MKITPFQEYCTEKLYTEFDRNWARNVENRSKYLLTHELSKAFNSPSHIEIWRET